MAVETQFGSAGAFEREGAISMIVHHLLGHRRAYHASCLQRAYDHGLHPILPGGADFRPIINAVDMGAPLRQAVLLGLGTYPAKVGGDET